MSRAPGLLALMLAVCLTGCAPSTGPELLVIDAADYHEAFDAADEAVRTVGMPPTLRDRRSGVIETDPRIAGSILEPWRTDNASLEQAVENTISFQRRRVRVEFTPAGFDPATADEGDELSGPDLLGLETPRRDLTRYEGEIELRVLVYLERSYTFGVRRSAWTRSLREQAQFIEPSDAAGSLALGIEQAEAPDATGRPAYDEASIFEQDDELRAIRPAYWQPVSRDPAFERRLLEEIRKRLEASS